MVVVLKTLIDLWRERLAYLDGLCKDGELPWFHLKVERRLLAILLRRHADAEYAEPPHQAEPLDSLSAKSSSELRMSKEALARIGLDPLKSEIPKIKEANGRRSASSAALERLKDLKKVPPDWIELSLRPPFFTYGEYPTPEEVDGYEGEDPLDAPAAPEPKAPEQANRLLPWLLVALLTGIVIGMLLNRW